MPDILSLAAANLLSPVVLCFALGVLAAAARSDLAIPEAVAKAISIYLMLAIGMKGGAAMAETGVAGAISAIGLAVALSFTLPLVGYALLRRVAGTPVADAAAIAAHYGSVSVVTFVTAQQFLLDNQISYEPYLVAMLAAMETPAIITGLLLARWGGVRRDPGRSQATSHLVREVLLNASVVLLVGGFVIGWLSGPSGMVKVKPLMVDLFNGLLCLFLLDMGLVAVRQLRSIRELRPMLIVFACVMPLIGAAAGLLAGLALGMSAGGTALFATLCASASYIAVPAAMRLALPEARPSIYITLSLGITFPLNIVFGIPLYYALAERLAA
jgi:hypothetical protein